MKGNIQEFETKTHMSSDIKIYVNFLQHIPQTKPIQTVLKKF